jgi:DNA-binding MarR family transcriptional regulator
MPDGLGKEIRKRKPFESAREEAHLNILRTAAITGSRHERLFRSRGLSSAAYNILRILRGEAAAVDGGRIGQRVGGPEVLGEDGLGQDGLRQGGVPMLVIGERLITQVPDVTRLVDRLERCGLVARSRTSEDRRVVLVRITGEGLAVLAELEEPLHTLLKQQYGHMTTDELVQLSGLLVKARSPSGSE